jgi:hypothetical protein
MILPRWNRRVAKLERLLSPGHEKPSAHPLAKPKWTKNYQYASQKLNKKLTLTKRKKKNEELRNYGIKRGKVNGKIEGKNKRNPLGGRKKILKTW